MRVVISNLGLGLYNKTQHLIINRSVKFRMLFMCGGPLFFVYGGGESEKKNSYNYIFRPIPSENKNRFYSL